MNDDGAGTCAAAPQMAITRAEGGRGWNPGHESVARPLQMAQTGRPGP